MELGASLYPLFLEILFFKVQLAIFSALLYLSTYFRSFLRDDSSSTKVILIPSLEVEFLHDSVWKSPKISRTKLPRSRSTTHEFMTSFACDQTLCSNFQEEDQIGSSKYLKKQIQKYKYIKEIAIFFRIFYYLFDELFTTIYKDIYNW